MVVLNTCVYYQMIECHVISNSITLQAEKLKVTDVVVLIDREQGGEAHLKKNGLGLHAAFKLSQLLDVLVKHSKVCVYCFVLCLFFCARHDLNRSKA